MQRGIIHLVSYSLIVASVIVFVAIGWFGIPRLLTLNLHDSRTDYAVDAEPVVVHEVQTNLEQLPIESVNIRAQAEYSVAVVPTEAVPTATSAPTGVPTLGIQKLDVEVASAEIIPSPTSTATSTPRPTTTHTTTPDTFRIRALETAWMFASLDREERWLGWYLAADMTAEVAGRSEDMQWLHVIHPVDGMNGWVAIEYVSLLNDSDLNDVVVSDYSVDVWSVRQRPEPVAGLNPQQVWPTATSASQGQWVVVSANKSWKQSSNQSAQVWPTATVAQKWPTPTPVQQAQWLPSVTPWPTPTPWPTKTLSPTSSPVRPTATSMPNPTKTPPPATIVPTLAVTSAPTPISESNAVAWWQREKASIQPNGDGSWRMDLIVRVPTSFTYQFEMENLTQIVRSQQNHEGDDYFVLTAWGMSCGEPLDAELIAYQNGARMTVQNEFTLEVGRVFVNPPC